MKTSERLMVVAGMLALLAGATIIWLHNSSVSSLPKNGFIRATPEAVVESRPGAAGVKAVATPPVLLASNAFTTLEDYRRRRAALPQTPPPMVTPPAGRTPETELGRVAFGVRDFRGAFGSNPVGSNKEITRALMGDNARGVRFLDGAAVSLNAKGELLDAWGMPYFFHALSGKVMEIRSAGPDGKVFTDDDLVQ